MPSRKVHDRRWLIDILIHASQAEQFVEGLSYDQFAADPLRIHAVTRCLEIISEASRRVPEAIKDCYPDIPWRDMAAAGNIYRHEYELVSNSQLWAVIKRRLPALRSAMIEQLAKIDDEPGGNPRPT